VARRQEALVLQPRAARLSTVQLPQPHGDGRVGCRKEGLVL